MDSDISIAPFISEDDEAAIALERSCPQGNTVKLRFIRSSFRRRSEVYDKSIIVSAKSDGRLVGVAAGALKNVIFRGKAIQVLYGYDLRVHPDFRKFGLARKLTDAVMHYFPDRIDSYYTYVAGQNERAHAFVKRGIGAQVMIPLTYVIIPVYKKQHRVPEHNNVSMDEIHNLYHINNPEVEYFTDPDPVRLIGYVGSVKLRDDKAGTSIWTNENILAEQVIGLPNRLKIMRLMQKIAAPIVKLPRMPGIGETLKSWLLFDFFAMDEQSLRRLLRIVNNLALNSGKDFIYILLQNNNPLLEMLQHSPLRMFTLPYIFMAKGKELPDCDDHIYIDIRDL
jgi:ribosomal protein S18 acetylase RimI-like enzyme